MTAIVVTGGSGFIGQALVRRLLDTDAEVQVPSRKPGSFPELSAAGATLVEADLGDRNACVEARPLEETLTESIEWYRQSDKLKSK